MNLKTSPLVWEKCPKCGTECCGEHKEQRFLRIYCKCGWCFMAENKNIEEENNHV